MRLHVSSLVAILFALGACAAPPPPREAAASPSPESTAPAPVAPAPVAPAALASAPIAPAPASAATSEGPRSQSPPAAAAPTEDAAGLGGTTEGAFVSIPDPRFGGADHATCGPFIVHNVLDESTDPGQPMPEPYVRVDRASGHQVYRARGRRYDFGGGAKLRMSLVADLCGDLTGDGVPELILTERTIGAHCCYTHYVVSLTQPTKTLLMWEKGDAGTGIWPVKAKPGPSWQLMSSVVTWPPFHGDVGLSYAGAPLLPIVFQLEGDTYRARTFRFGAFLRKHRQQAREHCRDHPDECGLSELIEWGYALIIGDWKKQRERVGAEPHLLETLDRHAAETRAQLVRDLGI